MRSCASSRRDTWAVGLWCEEFEQTSDAEVVDLLRSARESRAVDELVSEAARRSPAGAARGHDPARSGWAQTLEADLVIPDGRPDS